MAFPIRQRILSLTCLKPGPKAVLIEVCELVENGGRGVFDATNGYLVGKLGATERTVTRALALLEQRGLLVSTGQGKARRIFATDEIRACYIGSEADQLTAVRALNLDNSTPANLDKNGAEPSQIGEVGTAPNLDKTGAEPRQKWSANLDKNGGNLDKSGRAYKETTNTTSNDQDDHPQTPDAGGWVGKLVELQKKNEALEIENAELRAENARLKAQPQAPTPPPVAAPPHPAPSLPPPRPAAVSSWPPPDPSLPFAGVRLPFDSPEFAALWGRWRVVVAERGGKYAGPNAEQEALYSLTQHSGTGPENEAKARAIIEQSLSRPTWKYFSAIQSVPTHENHQRTYSNRVTGADSSQRHHLNAPISLENDRA